ncbi:hypothetical protein Q3G72_006494 [Acer saccharum]|nr:hypothetical protein Q3G72_006494 [Acer saccharum]
MYVIDEFSIDGGCGDSDHPGSNIRNVAYASVVTSRSNDDNTILKGMDSGYYVWWWCVFDGGGGEDDGK